MKPAAAVRARSARGRSKAPRPASVKVCGSPYANEVVRECAAPRSGEKTGVPKALSAEEAAVWLWAWPELLDWPAPIHWMFTFRAGTHDASAAWPGLLWGVDADGELLLVDAVVGAANRRADLMRPFLAARDPLRAPVFGNDPTRHRAAGPSSLQSETLMNRWREILAGEREFHAATTQILSRSRPALPECDDGLLSAAGRCQALIRWRHLYTGPIAERFLSAAYEQDVIAALGRRRARFAPAPHYVGLLMSRSGGAPSLAKKSAEGLRHLFVQARPSHVHVRSLQVAHHRGNAMIVARRPTLLELIGE